MLAGPGHKISGGRLVLGALFALSLSSGAALAQDNPPDNTAAVDKIFAAFIATTPGCAAGAEQNGQTLFAKAYGQADLEHGVPITPKTMFHMASTAKQFTAMAVLLLAEQGKISLADSIRKYVPELPAYADKITLADLLHHVSGIRDYTNIGIVTGDINRVAYTNDDVLKILARQQGLNFAPESDYHYSNSGYVLLSILVKRVTGQDFGAFAGQKIFAPLGMNASQFVADHTALIPDKAFGYVQRGGDWHAANMNFDTTGDGGLYSSLEDMLRWTKNFENPTVGANALAQMQISGALADGTETQYGMGFELSDYRGLKEIAHGGDLGGYHSDVAWFPDQKFSVVVMCNSGSANPSQLAERIADVYLAAQLQPMGQSASASPYTGAVDIQAKAGFYRSDFGQSNTLATRSGKLFGGRQSNVELVPTGAFTFQSRNAQGGLSGGAYTFDTHAPAWYFDYGPPGQPQVRYRRGDAVTVSVAQRKAYAGTFLSADLGAAYHILAAGDGLSLDDGDDPVMPLQNIGRDKFFAARIGMEVDFTRNGKGKVTGFTVNVQGLHQMLFRRV